MSNIVSIGQAARRVVARCGVPHVFDMPASEAVYYHAAHWAHIVAWEEHHRLKCKEEQARRAYERNRRYR